MAKKKDEPVAIIDEPLEPIHVPDEPAPVEKPVYDVRRPDTLIPLIAQAWDKSKGAGDASFNDCQPTFKNTLMGHALDTLKSDKALQQDGPLATFEREILANK